MQFGLGPTIQSRRSALGLPRHSAAYLKLVSSLLLLPVAAAAQTGVVDFVFYAGGEEIENDTLAPELALFKDSSGGSIAFQFKDGRLKAPYGLYRLVIYQEGFKEYRRTLRVDRFPSVALVHLKLGDVADVVGLPARIVLDGSIRTENPVQKLWVRFLPTSGAFGEAFDARVSRDLEFSLDLGYRRNAEDFILTVLAEVEESEPWPRKILTPIHAEVVTVSPYGNDPIEVVIGSR